MSDVEIVWQRAIFSASTHASCAGPAIVSATRSSRSTLVIGSPQQTQRSSVMAAPYAIRASRELQHLAADHC